MTPPFPQISTPPTHPKIKYSAYFVMYHIMGVFEMRESGVEGFNIRGRGLVVGM